VAKSLWTSFGSTTGGQFGPNNTVYGYVAMSATCSYVATEATAQTTVNFAGTFSNYAIVMSLNTLTTASQTFIFRKNGSDGSQTISVTAGSSGYFEDTTGTDTVSSGDLINTRRVVASGGSGTSRSDISTFIFDSTVDPIVIFRANQSTTTSATTFTNLAGAGTGAATTTTNEFSALGTFRKFGVNIVTNTRSSSSTGTLAINSIAGNESFSIPASTSGFFQDTTNSDTTTLTDDTVGGAIVMTAGTGSMNIGTGGTVEFYSSDTNKFMMITASSGGATVGFGVTRYISYCGNMSSSGTESARAIKTNLAFTAANLQIYIRVNTVNGSSTYDFRKNSSNGNMSISIPATTTGYFKDTSNTDSVATTDVINMRLVGGGSSGSFEYNIGSTMGILPVTPSVGDNFQMGANF